MTFGRSSSLERIGFSCFEQTAVEVTLHQNAAAPTAKGAGGRGKGGGGKEKCSRRKGRGPKCRQ